MLTADEEKTLALKLRDQNDLEAAQKLVLSHLRLVISIARGFLGYGLPYADLIQEGNIGLMKAIRRYDPDRGARLMTFAVHWIRSEIQEYIIRNWRIVKLATLQSPTTERRQPSSTHQSGSPTYRAHIGCQTQRGPRYGRAHVWARNEH